MAIISGSRYQSTEITQAPGRGGVVTSVLSHSEAFDRQYAFTLYQWTQDDRPDLVAAGFYGNDQLWWQIARANPEILDWNSVPMGTIIRVPNA
jgi:hypothetical protein